MKVTEKIDTVIFEKMKTSITSAINHGRLLTSQCSCQVLRKFCIDNSTAKFISLVVQIFLAGLAIANSFKKTYVWLLKEIMLHDTNQTSETKNNK